MCFLYALMFPGFPPQSSPSHIKIGDKVRVKLTVTTPKYKWGSVTHRSVGVVKGKSRYRDFCELNSILFIHDSITVLIVV